MLQKFIYCLVVSAETTRSARKPYSFPRAAETCCCVLRAVVATLRNCSDHMRKPRRDFNILLGGQEHVDRRTAGRRAVGHICTGGRATAGRRGAPGAAH